MSDVQPQFLMLDLLHLLFGAQPPNLLLHLGYLALYPCLLAPRFPHPVHDFLILLLECPLSVPSSPQLDPLQTVDFDVPQLVALKQRL